MKLTTSLFFLLVALIATVSKQDAAAVQITPVQNKTPAAVRKDSEREDEEPTDAQIIAYLDAVKANPENKGGPVRLRGF